MKCLKTEEIITCDICNVVIKNTNELYICVRCKKDLCKKDFKKLVLNYDDPEIFCDECLNVINEFIKKRSNIEQLSNKNILLLKQQMNIPDCICSLKE